MIVEIIQDGETVGTVTTAPLSFDGDVPESVRNGLSAPATERTGDGAERWTEPDEKEVYQRLVSISRRRSFEINITERN